MVQLSIKTEEKKMKIMLLIKAICVNSFNSIIFVNKEGGF